MPGKLPLQGCTFVRDNLSYSGLVPGEFRTPVLTWESQTCTGKASEMCASPETTAPRQ